MTRGKLFFISTLSLISCFPLENPRPMEGSKPDDMTTFCIEKVSRELFASAKKTAVDKLIKDTTAIKKQNGQFKLPLASGVNNYKTFQDSINGSEDENRKEYNYVGQFREIDFYAVSVTYWEHSEILLIDKKSGNHYSSWSVPSLSPNNEKMAAILSFGLEGAPVGIQILSIDKTSDSQIEKLIEIDQRLWDPVDFVWENNNALLLKVTELIDYSKETEPKKDKTFSYLRLKINSP